jgi:allantoicase
MIFLSSARLVEIMTQLTIQSRDQHYASEFEKENYFKHIIISMSGDGGVSINNYLHPEVLKWQ